MDYITDNSVVVETEANMDSSAVRHESYYMLLGESKEIRQKSGISQTKIAQDLGITQDKISNYESGKISPRLDVYLRYLDLLGYTLKIVPKE